MRIVDAVILSTLWVGCGKHRRADVGRGPLVDRIEFEGNGNSFSETGDYQLRATMVQEQNAPLVWLAPARRGVHLDDTVLALDGWRIETWYAHHGFFDAHFLGWDVVTLKNRGKYRPDLVGVVGYVDEGTPSVVRDLEFEGLGLGKPALVGLQQRADLQTGETFSVEGLKNTRSLVLHTLQQRSYARATVQTSVDVYPEEEAVDVHFVAERGDACKFGEVSLIGDFTIPEDLIRDEINVVPGKAYRADELSKTQRAIFGLGVFSVVNVIPVLDGDETDVVPVEIELTQTKARQLRLGGGVELESGKQSIHVNSEFQHDNVWNRLVRLTAASEIGYSALTQVNDISDGGLDEMMRGPTTDTSLTFVLLRFPRRAWTVETEWAFEMGVEEGYRYATPEFSPSISWNMAPMLTLGFAYHLRYFDYIEPQLESFEWDETALGMDFTDPYLLSFVSQQLILDSREGGLVTRSGLYGIYEISEAGGPFGGQYNFIRLSGDQRGYLNLVRYKFFGRRPEFIKLTKPVLANRIGAGVMMPYGSDPDRAQIPYAELFTLGGSSDVRGWVRNHLGPYICDTDEIDACTSERGVSQPSEEIIPIGGAAKLFGGTELRVYNAIGYGAAIFCDVGMVWTSMADMNPMEVIPAVGAGGRYKSPIGPVRLDVAYRLGNEPMFEQEPRLNIYFALSEAF